MDALDLMPEAMRSICFDPARADEEFAFAAKVPWIADTLANAPSALDIFRYRNTVDPWPAPQRRRTFSTRLATRTVAESWTP